MAFINITLVFFTYLSKIFIGVDNMTNELNKFLFDNKFKVDNKFAYGIYNDRTMSIKERGSYTKVSISFNTQINKETGMQISNKLKELKTKHRALQHAITTNVCVELVIYKSADFQEEFYVVLNDCLKLLDQHIPAMVDICPICGQIKQSNSPFVRIKDTVIQGHEHCIDQLIQASNQMGANALLKFDKVNFIKTLLASMLVFLAILGCVCIASYYGMFGFVASLSGWITFFVVNIVLKKLNIQIKKDQIIIVSVVSLLTLFASVYFGSIVDIYRNVNASSDTFILIFKEYFTILSQNMDTLGKYVLIDLLIGLLFVIPTIIANFKQLTQTLNSIKKLN